MLAFETAFFVDLPDRERRYGIADAQVRRFGYHGLYHQTAAEELQARRAEGPTRTISLCLEPQPELAAVIGHRPVFVTSGATPLEGLPGETTCGELDPTVVLALARARHWGPEQINDVLTHHSGLRGLLEPPTTLGDLLAGSDWPAGDGRLPPAADGSPAAARNLLAYRVLLAAGAAAAAMGGIDRLVITGRYASQGAGLGRWLARRLGVVAQSGLRPRVVSCLTPLSRILADQAAAGCAADACPAATGNL
jgi:acetate kinase